MHRRAGVLGGSVAGLAIAVALARRGWSVDVIERDPLPAIGDGDEAFTDWQRPGVPQFRQAHAFSARSRNLLLEHLYGADGVYRESANTIEILSAKPPRRLGPTRGELLELLERARATAG